MSKKVFSFVVVLMMCLFLTQTIAANGGRDDESGAVELRWSFWGGDARFAKYEEIANRYMAANPNVTIVREPMSWGDYWTKIPTQIAGGAAPDIMQMHARYVTNFTQSNALLDLGPLVKDGTIDLSNFTAAGIQTGVIGGKNVMVDIGLVTTGVVYNTAITEKYGITMPADSWDYARYEAFLLDAAKKLPEGVYATSDDSMNTIGTSAPLTIFMRTRGKDMYDASGKLGFSQQDLKDWFVMWDNLRQGGAVPNAALSSEEAAKTWEQTMFIAGDMLLQLLPANRLRIFQEQMPDTLLLMQRTPKTGRKGGEFLEGAHMAINAKTDNPIEAAQFISWFVNSEESLEIYKAENGWPASTVMLEFIKPLQTEVEQRGAALVASVAADEGLTPYVTPPPENADVSRELDRQAQAIGFGQKSIDEAVADFFKAAEDLL